VSFAQYIFYRRYTPVPFVSHDPPEFLDPARIREVLVHHESGHLLLLYYYGCQIGGFTCRQAGQDWMGSMRNRRIPDAPMVDTAVNLMTEAQKLLAGELAARIRIGLPIDRMLMPMDAPPAEVLTAQTSLDDLCPQADQRFDAIRVLGRYVHNRHHLGGNWWAWMWDRHAEAQALLQANWPIVEALAERLPTVDAAHLDGGAGHLVGQVNGDQLLQWCDEVGAPILNADAVSVSY
jgi:hypothetical protein